MTAWGTAHEISTAETLYAPAVTHGAQLTVWSGADDAETRHYACALSCDAPTILALPAFFPLSQRLFPAAEGRHHLLYLDYDAEYDQQRLFAATIAPNITAELGPNPVSNRRTGHYDAALDADGNLRIVWSGGSLSEPDLYTQRIDRAGRIALPERITYNGDVPALAATNDGAMHVFWRYDASSILRGRLDDNTLTNVRRIMASVPIRAGERLENLQAAFDTTHAYLFWQIVNANGSAQAWWASSPRDAAAWRAPQPLGFLSSGASQIAPGLNVGTVNSAHAGETRVEWLNVLAGEYATLPAVITLPDEIGILYWREGDIVGYQTIVETTGRLFSAPQIALAPQQYVTITWVAPDGTLYATTSSEGEN